MKGKAKPFLRDFTPPKLVNDRRHGRLHCSDIRCNLGIVLDISASGMRVQCDGPPPQLGATQSITIPVAEGTLELRVLARWCRSMGARSEIGVEFLDLTDAQRAALLDIVRTSVHEETIRPDLERVRLTIAQEAADESARELPRNPE